MQNTGHYFSSSIGKLLLSNSILIQIRQNLPPAPAATKLPAAPEHTPVPQHQRTLPSGCPCSWLPLARGGRGSQTALPSLCGRLREQRGHPPSLPPRPLHTAESLLLPPRENGLLTTRAGQDGGSHRSEELLQLGLKQHRQTSQNLESHAWPLPYSQPMDVSLLPWYCNTRSFKDHVSSPPSSQVIRASNEPPFPWYHLNCSILQ